MRVETICAELRTVFSSAMGRAMRAAFARQRRVGRQEPRSSVRRRAGLLKAMALNISAAVQSSARAVPSAAPATPMPAPGMVKPRAVIRVGKMSRPLNTTSNRHMSALKRLGIFMLPLHWSMLPEISRSSTAGTARA